MRRFAFAVALVAGVAPVLAAPAVADLQLANVTVNASGAKPTTTALSESTLVAKNCPTFPPPAAAPTLDGLAYPFPAGATWSLDTVLTCGLGLAPQAGDTVQVQRGNGQWEPALTYPQDLTSQSSSTLVPVILDNGGPEYFRPQRDASDQNAIDHVANNRPVAIMINLGGAPLTVSIAPGTTTQPLGTTVTYTGTVVDQHTSPTLSYSWSILGGAAFKSGTTSRTASITFNKAGTYALTLQVSDNQGSGGADTISVTVGNNPGSKKSHSPGNGHKPTHNSGPSGHKHSTTSGGAGSGTTTTTTTTTTTPPATTTTTTTTAQVTPPSTTTTSPVRPLPPTAPAPPLVVGQLVSDVIPLPAATSPLTHPAQPTTAPAARASGGSPLPIIGASLTIFLLLALGAATELGWRPDWQALRFGG